MCSATSASAAPRAACSAVRSAGSSLAAQGIARHHRQVAPPALPADAADRAAFGAAQEPGLVPGPQRDQRGARSGWRASKSGSVERCAYLFQGQASWQSSQP
jgi:hypothetical protein